MIKYDERGLVPAVIQDVDNGDVLMLGYMNKEALRLTLESGDVWFWSRSRSELWHKGETSGNFLRMRSVQVDCDGDTLLV
jgi:phosphoribosyl-ATP pyrophosphohydrolase/phosphoribosyl-AMP cyclohydrolase